MNVRPKLADGSDNPLSNQKVRQALNYAIDKEAIIQIVTHGVGSPQTSFMSSTTPYHVGAASPYPYDASKAKQLLPHAGHSAGFPNIGSPSCRRKCVSVRLALGGCRIINKNKQTTH